MMESANQSLQSNSLINRENTGNFFDFDRSANGPWATESQTSLRVFQQTPYSQRNRDLNVEQGMK